MKIETQGEELCTEGNSSSTVSGSTINGSRPSFIFVPCFSPKRS